jgi:uncharacterized protein (UPF0333 family)
MVFIITAVVLILLAAVAFFVIQNRGKTMAATRVDVNYTNKNAIFLARGKLDDFVIQKNDRFAFLVRDGVIVACKDNQKHQDFVFYTEVEK